ncbi:MAG: mechanosensitive ion channel family protein [Paludibacter sp.]|nr:mechanosensitive ion channel family protein [Paludibacter sp.]
MHIFDTVYYGNSLTQWLISLLIIVGAVLLNKIIVLVNKKVVHKITSKTKSRLDDILFRMLEAPVMLGIMLLAIWIASSRLELGTSVDKFFSKSYQFLIVINVTWFVVRFVNALIEEYLVPIAEDNTHKYLDNTLIPIIRRGTLGAIWAIGVIMALKNVGVDVGAMIAGLGIGGLAFALAAQDTIKNIFGGVTIFTDRPFRIGDRIKVDGFDGIVEDIGIRSTRLRTLERRLVTIPNYKIVEASIENITEEPMRKVVMTLGLTYDTTPEKMSEAMAILKGMPKTIKEIDPKDFLVVFSDFSAYSLDIKFIYWVKKSGDVMETPSKVNMEILKAFNNAGLNFAFPTQTIVMEPEQTGL